MIRPEGFRGAAFGTALEGDARSDTASRRAMSRRLAIDEQWAAVTQVHGATVTRAASPGNQGEADAIVTMRPGLPITVATADCLPIVIEGDLGVAVVHAGWRGVVAGVVPAALDAMRTDGIRPLRAAIGPGIGPCCFEVGSEVADLLPEHRAQTSWGATSVDLSGAITAQLGSLPTWASDVCTYTSDDLNSYRRDHTRQRQVAVAWLPAA